jgi:hypothetical protein
MVAFTMLSLCYGDLALAKDPAPSGSSVGRYIALQPPPARDKTYANFLWVLDTTTGDVTGYRFANVKDAKGNIDAWITERLPSDKEYPLLLNSQPNSPLSDILSK